MRALLTQINKVLSNSPQFYNDVQYDKVNENIMKTRKFLFLMKERIKESCPMFTFNIIWELLERKLPNIFKDINIEDDSMD